MIRIVIADDHPIVRDGVKQILSEQSDMVVIGEAVSGDELLERLAAELPDVVLCDMSMPGRSGIELIRAIKNQWPKLPVLVLSMHEDDLYVVRTIKAGASGYLTKACPSTQLVAAVRRVAAGRVYVNEDVAEKLALQVMSGTSSPHSVLSDREFQVFVMLAEGLTVSEIAKRLYLSVKTVSTHKTNIMQKMNFANMAELVRYSLEQGLTRASGASGSRS